MSLVALPDGTILGVSTVAPGTGGERKAEQAELYIFDLKTKKLLWHERVLPNVYGYTDMCLGKNGLVFGFADSRRFFVFDPRTKKILHQEDISSTLGATSGGQGPRVFVRVPDGTIYVLLSRGIARLDQEKFSLTMVARSPVPIGVGGDYCDGRIFFARGSHLYSYKLPE